jgi:predicted RNase H-like HicB family nuclease
MMQKYKLPVTVRTLEDGTYMAHCESVRAAATGDTGEEAIKNLREAVTELVQEFGEDAVFQNIDISADVQLIECAV